MKSLELVQRCLVVGCLLAVCAKATPINSQPVDGGEDAENNSNSNGGRVIYDQRQSGKYNIRISIKDVAIIEMDQNGFGDGDFNEEDYYYDDADLTVKPINLTQPKPTSATVDKQSSTSAAAATTTTTATTRKTTTATAATTNTQTPSSAAPSTSNSTPMLTMPNSHTATYSVNLLADIAASQAAATTTTTTTAAKSKTPSVVILENTSPFSTQPKQTQHVPLYASELSGRSKHIPVHLALPLESKIDTAAMEQTATTTSLQQELQQAEHFKHIDAENDSRIFNFKMQRANKPPSASHVRHCRHNQYRDMAGNCRTKRSTSFLRKLFSMFAAFPFARIERDHDNE